MASDLRKRKGTWIFGHASVTFWIRRFGSAMWAVGPRHAAGTARATSAVQVLNDGRNIDGLGFVRALPEAAPIKNRDVGTRHWVPFAAGRFPAADGHGVSASNVEVGTADPFHLTPDKRTFVRCKRRHRRDCVIDQPYVPRTGPRRKAV